VANNPKPLKRSSDFLEISSKGRKIKAAPWLLLQVLPSPDGSNYYGLTISRKVGSSVIRNRLKRWVRNCVRSEKWPEQFNSKKVVFVFRPQSADGFYKQLKYAQFRELYKKL